MISKVAYGLNSVALILCILIAWEIFSTQAENEFLQNELKIMATKSAEMKFAVEEAKNGQADKLNREKRKNSELEESGNAKTDEIVDLERKRDELKTSTEVADQELEDLSASIQKSKLSMAGMDAEVRTAQENLRRLSMSIPVLEQEISILRNQISNEEKRKFDLDEKLTTYEKETQILKQHYDYTIVGLKKDFYEHPWLERGERLTVSSSTLDLVTGILVLPVGKNHGIEQSMLFSVRAKGKNICQVRIKEVAFDHCVAMIVPLLGSPKELMEIKDFDLVYL
jgi:predicted RNase H-like nuclease (RuvC/YqgF family)